MYKVLIFFLCIPSIVMAGTLEPLSSREEVIFDFRSMTPTPENQLIVTENGFKYYDLSNVDRIRDETPHTGGTWHNTINNYAGGAHASSRAWKYLDFTDVNCYHGGACLQTTVTGGTFAGGTQHQYKPGWLESPVHGSGVATGTYFYVMVINSGWTSSANNNVPFPEAKPDTGSYNRMSYYFLPHPDVAVGTGRYPRSSHNVGPRNDISGTAHWYHRVYLNGGGWWHVQVDTHPHHINVARRNVEPRGKNFIANHPDFFDTLSDFYIMQAPMTGFEYGPLPYKETVSPFVFWEDTEPQNDETILGLGTMWNISDHHGELSFESKYLDPDSYGLYELRYSFSPITNANWSSATPVHVRAYSPFFQDARTDGIFIRPIPSRGCTWVSFDLATSADETNLEDGATIYYAVKDIGQLNGNSQTPRTGADCLGTAYSQCGTDYAGHPDDFDYATDQDDLLLIKRISYRIAHYQSSSHVIPPPANLRLTMNEGL